MSFSSTLISTSSASGRIATDERENFLQPTHSRLARRGDFHLPAARFEIAGVHAEDFIGEKAGLIAASAGADFEHHVLLIERIFGQHQNAQIVFNLRELGPKTRDFLLRHAPHLGVGIFEHGFRLREIAVHTFEVAVLVHHFFERTAHLRDFAIGVTVADDGRIGHLLGDLVEADF
jgi:hypothetical protein